jgi:hypothetical protein
MKTIFLILSLLFVTFVNSQTINDLLYIKINKYRKENNEKELIVCNEAKIANTQQLDYMISTSTVPLDHTQKIQTNNDKTFKSFDERIEYIYGDNYEYVGENLIGLYYDETKTEMADKIFTLWKNSPGHNVVMLSDEPECFYINSEISNKIIVNDFEYLGDKIIYCVLTTFK